MIESCLDDILFVEMAAEMHQDVVVENFDHLDTLLDTCTITEDSIYA